MCCKNEAAKTNFQAYLLLNNTDMAHGWTGRKVFRLKDCNQNEWKEKIKQPKHKTFSNYENMGPVL